MNKECSPARHVDDSDDGQEVKPVGHVDTGAVVASELLLRATGQLEDGCVRGGEGARPAVMDSE